MRNVFKSVAICVVVGMSLPLGVLAADAPTASSDPVVVEKIGERRFRLVNNSMETLTYKHWLNQEVNPVPYCKYPNDSISICSRDVHLDSNGKPALEEARLKPGKSITFDAIKGKAVAVGALLSIDGEQRIVWCEL